MAGSTFKRCGCRDETGRQLGRKCPNLRSGNRWNPRHGVWHLQIELPTRTGEPRIPLRYGPFDQEQDAEDLLDEIRTLLALPDRSDHDATAQVVAEIRTALRDRSPLPKPDHVRSRLASGMSADELPTVAQWLTRWLAGRRALRRNTYRAYESHVRLYLIPAIGNVRIDRLRVSHLDNLFTGIDAHNERIHKARTSQDPKAAAAVKGRRVVGAASQQRIRGVLRKALNDAIARGIITTNPAVHVELAAGRRPKPRVWTSTAVARWQATGEIPSKVMVWTPEQTGQFLDHITDHRLYALYHLVAFRGLRRGEVCGLREDDLNLAGAELTVRTQLVQIGWEVEEGEPKTDAGHRVIALDTGTIQTLRDHLVVREAERALTGTRWVDKTGLIFTEPGGALLHPANVTDTFTALIADAGLPPIRLHDLRHGAATLALAAGVDMKIVQDMLGHSCFAITADTYTTVLPDVARTAAEALAAHVPRRANAPR
ncbi:site-specific integrase [Pseudonocardia sp. TRM90224]|uniref:site-specific integrase n=1 Tax=Pseudonocardia sp. TRM90224 TaxID=2812678 RepID=UPI001E58D970|nr:site-specific integrase [Pseudonocardia sp. TRM90224]